MTATCNEELQRLNVKISNMVCVCLNTGLKLVFINIANCTLSMSVISKEDRQYYNCDFSTLKHKIFRKTGNEKVYLNYITIVVFKN